MSGPNLRHRIDSDRYLMTRHQPEILFLLVSSERNVMGVGRGEAAQSVFQNPLDVLKGK
jgi:hypothetical protein